MPKASIQSINGTGHTPVLHPGTELVEFSQTAALNEPMEVVAKNMENMA